MASKKLNILIFSWRDPKHPLAGGAEQVVHEHSKGWIKSGREVTLFSSSVKGLEKEEVKDGVKIIRGGHQYLGVQIAGFFFYLKNKKKYDLVIDQFHGIPFFTPLYVRKPRLALIQEVAKEVWFKNPLSFPLNLLVGVIGYITEPFIFLFYRSTPFMTGSDSAKEELSGYGIEKKNITVVPHGAKLKKISPLPTKEDKKTIIYLGVISKDKGIEDAIETFNILNKRGSFNFWVVGRSENPKYLKKIKRIVRKKGLSANTTLFGFVSQEKKFNLLAKAHLMVNPSVREGWGLVNIEANSVKTPVIAYNSPGLVDSVKDGTSGVILDNNSPEKMAEEIVKILGDKDRYK